MFATVHAAGSSLLGLFSSCSTFDSTDPGTRAPPHPRAAPDYEHERRLRQEGVGVRYRWLVACMPSIHAIRA
eukprot:scaffold1583_cov105-Isochrysis_galbana.AAC.7